VEITKTDAYDLIGRVVEIIPRSRELPINARTDAGVPARHPHSHGAAPVEKLHRISTGAPLRVLA